MINPKIAVQCTFFVNCIVENMRDKLIQIIMITGITGNRIPTRGMIRNSAAIIENTNPMIPNPIPSSFFNILSLFYLLILLYMKIIKQKIKYEKIKYTIERPIKL